MQTLEHVLSGQSWTGCSSQFEAEMEGTKPPLEQARDNYFNLDEHRFVTGKVLCLR